ncbi:PLP-dependent aminotransferase family protein [Aneurinibacillus migulanus]|uniref:aminotransferase-like domain-containing protein n=1 Tax=Aneurinibacillus migulanus TaxID=47500 RepID=UPI002E203F5E|nr:PLP-dependent aminotransferase family protein [Aneurinibacillus migulanus]
MYKYLSILNDLENIIQSGRYKEGERLPSIRALAEQYGCSKSTIIRTFDELEKKHIVYSSPQSGHYVVKRKHKNNGNPLILDFASSAPDPNIFPYLDFQHCINKAIDTYKNDLFIYGTSKGLPSLISVVQKQLANYQVFADTDSIFVTSGVQQALAILTTVPFPNGNETVLIEQPGYHLFIEYLETHNIPTLGIKRNSAGIDLLELERIFQTENIKFFYTMPRFHNPLGTSYSRIEKERIAKLAEKYDVFIVEDDYLADLEQDAKADPIYSYDVSAHVIYLKSYSKIIFPGLRIGIAIIPASIAGAFSTYKKILDIDSSMISQAALEIYIKNKMFERHKQKVRSSYSRRTVSLLNALEKHAKGHDDFFSYTSVKNPCIHTFIQLDKRISIQKLTHRLRKKSIIVEPAHHHYLSSFEKEPLLKLNVSNVKVDDIERGIQQILAEICR